MAILAAGMVIAAPAVPAMTATAGAGAEARPAAGRPLYVTNILSSNVSVFTAGRDGHLSPRGDPVDTGESPRGVVVTPDGRAAYVANGAAGTVTAYRIRGDGGLDRPAPAATPEDPVAVAVAPDGRHLYVVSRAARTVSTFRIGPDGTLSDRVTVDSGDDNPRAVAVTPDGRFAYVSHGDPTDKEPDTLSIFRVSGGTLVAAGSVGIGAAGGQMAVTPDGRFLYVPCSASRDVFVFAINRDGSLRRLPRVKTPGVPVAAAVTPDGRRLYVTDGGLVGSGVRLVSAFTIRGDGTLRRLGEATAGVSPVGLTPAPDGRFLYVSNIDSNDVTVFAIRPGGRLAKIADVPTGGVRPAFQSIAIVPDQGPVAAFTAQASGRTVRFDASGSADPDGRVARYDWDFGDGTRLADGGPRPVHSYGRTGSFRVTLTVTDDEGCADVRVHTGVSVLCNGSAAARTARTVTVR